MKGQTAIEYLMTYGWAILIILIVAGVLAYYGIFAPSGFLAPTARGFGQLQVRSPWSITPTDGMITMDVENRVGQTINVTNIYATIGSTEGTCAVVDPDEPSGPQTILSGEHTIVSCDLSAITGTAGSQYTATVAIEYYTLNSPTFSFNSTGTISGTY